MSGARGPFKAVERWPRSKVESALPPDDIGSVQAGKVLWQGVRVVMAVIGRVMRMAVRGHRDIVLMTVSMSIIQAPSFVVIKGGDGG